LFAQRVASGTHKANGPVVNILDLLLLLLLLCIREVVRYDTSNLLIVAMFVVADLQAIFRV
jgi:hypothetical protein